MPPIVPARWKIWFELAAAASIFYKMARHCLNAALYECSEVNVALLPGRPACPAPHRRLPCARRCATVRHDTVLARLQPPAAHAAAVPRAQHGLAHDVALTLSPPKLPELPFAPGLCGAR